MIFGAKGKKFKRKLESVEKNQHCGRVLLKYFNIFLSYLFEIRHKQNGINFDSLINILIV